MELDIKIPFYTSQKRSFLCVNTHAHVYNACANIYDIILSHVAHKKDKYVFLNGLIFVVVGPEFCFSVLSTNHNIFKQISHTRIEYIHRFF